MTLLKYRVKNKIFCHITMPQSKLLGEYGDILIHVMISQIYSRVISQQAEGRQKDLTRDLISRCTLIINISLRKNFSYESDFK